MPFSPRQIARQIQALPREKRIVFMHPNLKDQHLLLNDLLQDAVYLRVEGQNIDDLQLQQQLDSAMERQTGQAKRDGMVGFLILDECDRVSDAALPLFFQRALARTASERFVVFSRVLPNGFMDDRDLRRQSTFLPTDPRLMLWDYAQEADTVLLEVRAFGEGRVQLNGRIIDTWDGALPRALFFFLIDRGMVTRSDIFATFWPNLSTREATNVFHVTKRKISEVLGTELTMYGSSFYHISPKIQLSYDVMLFNQLVQDSENAPGAGDALRQALALYRGDYLMSLKSHWVLDRRDSLQHAACDALVSLGRLCESQENPQEALTHYLHATYLRPEREDSAFAVMRLYRDLGQPEQGLQVYRRLDKTLNETLHVAPSSQIQQLAAELERH